MSNVTVTFTEAEAELAIIALEHYRRNHVDSRDPEEADDMEALAAAAQKLRNA